jgi:hypothetical protein
MRIALMQLKCGGGHASKLAEIESTAETKEMFHGLQDDTGAG